MSIEINLENKTIMITGAAGGIGSGTVKVFAEAGANLILTDISEAVLNQAELINLAGGKALGVIADITDAKDVANVVDAGVKEFGQLDFAFNNAGISGLQKRLEDLTTDEWDQILKVNLSSVAYCMSAQAKVMMRNGGGVIINNSSVLGLGVFPNQSLVYSATKHGVIGLTKQAAANHGKDNIRINAICPGLVLTPVLDRDGTSDQVDGLIQRIPMGRPGTPEEMGKMALALCSDLGAYVTGVALPVDGGFSLN